MSKLEVTDGETEQKGRVKRGVRRLLRFPTGAKFEEDCVSAGAWLVMLAFCAEGLHFKAAWKGQALSYISTPWLLIGILGFVFSQLFPSGRKGTLALLKQLATIRK